MRLTLASWYRAMIEPPDRTPAVSPMLNKPQRGGGALVVMAVKGEYEPRLGLLAMRCEADGRITCMLPADEAHIATFDEWQSNPRRVADEEDGA